MVLIGRYHRDRTGIVLIFNVTCVTMVTHNKGVISCLKQVIWQKAK